VKVKGLLSASPYPELKGTYHIISSSGFISEIEFEGRGFFKGEKNGVHASLYRKNEKDRPVFTVKGAWNKSFMISDSNGNEIETYDVVAADSKPGRMNLLPLEKQDPWESRRLWNDTATSLERGDMGGSAKAKSKIEQAQRNMRSYEEQNGMKWEPLFFHQGRLEGIEKLEKLAMEVGAAADVDQREIDRGWVFDHDKYTSAQRPFHGKDVVPTGYEQEPEMQEQATSDADSKEQEKSELTAREHDKKPFTNIESEKHSDTIEKASGKSNGGSDERQLLETILRDKYSNH
jgi:oxysterol-binding protein-related protein 9/10/11